jgi:FtsP/CotA-like multicopper oxidase with cupredoxin domain
VISRRRFVHGFAGAAFVLGTARWNATRGAETPPGSVLRGTQFDLTIDELPVSNTGARRTAVAINGQVPGPTLRFREGDTVTIRVTNKLRTTTALHWHGLIVPADMDGVPGVSFAGIAPARRSSIASR